MRLIALLSGCLNTIKGSAARIDTLVGIPKGFCVGDHVVARHVLILGGKLFQLVAENVGILYAVGKGTLPVARGVHRAVAAQCRRSECVGGLELRHLQRIGEISHPAATDLRHQFFIR